MLCSAAAQKWQRLAAPEPLPVPHDSALESLLSASLRQELPQNLSRSWRQLIIAAQVDNTAVIGFTGSAGSTATCKYLSLAPSHITLLRECIAAEPPASSRSCKAASCS